MRLSVWLLFLVPYAALARAPGDSSSVAATWHVVGEGRTTTVEAADVEAARDSVLAPLLRDGHYFARVDSAGFDSTGGGTLFVTRGPRYVVDAIEIGGASAIPRRELLGEMSTRVGRVLDGNVLEEDLAFILRRYEDVGRPLASIEVAAVEIVEGTTDQLRLRLEIEEGPAPVLAGIEIDGDTRTRPGFIARVAGLRAGGHLRRYRSEDVRARLEATGFYRNVGLPRIRMVSDSSAVLVFPLEENAPGSFDLVLGFLPPTSPGEALGVVGNGHLELNNLFGGGRVLALRLNRLPGQTSSADVRVYDPFILGLPLGVEARFSGLQQDSTYTKQRYEAELGVRLALGMQGFVSLGREVTRPGVASRGTIARADAWFAGVGVRMRRVNSIVSPTRGYLFEATVESGRKNRSTTGPDAPEATGPEAVDQERVRTSGRLYVPVGRRQVLVAGADAAAVVSGVRDQSDLIRFGGATTLRGYDEDRFLARTVARGLIEYRYLLDRQSFAFLFVDVGYIDAPALSGVAAMRGFHPGYGLGLQFETGVGLVSASYAISSEAGPTNGRIHVGLSFGL